MSSNVRLSYGNFGRTARAATFLAGAGCLYFVSGSIGPNPDFKKRVIDSRFVAEAVALGDVNRDGKLDIIAGNFWYEAPEFAPREIAPFQLVDPQKAYSNCFSTWAEDVNKDGWIDQILIGMPGEKAVWRENPKGKKGDWPVHEIWRSACNESPLYEDLLGTGKRVIVMGFDDQYLAWFEPSTDRDQAWQCHIASGVKGAGSQRYSHGLGVGDINGDGRKDIITTQGYYLAPKNRRDSPWKFIPIDLGPDCAHMIVLDVNQDKLPDILTTSAHARGVWCFLQSIDGKFRREIVDQTISVTHSAALMKLGSQKRWNLITGKRKWAHPPGVDVGSDEADWIVRYELVHTKSGAKWVRQIIDENSGVGTQFVTGDVNRDGREDIVTANKNGVFLFEQR